MPPPDPPLRVPEIGDKYQVVRVLGKGAMGTVYEAHHKTLQKRVAIKVLHEQHAGDADLTERFLREAVAVSRLRSRFIVRVHDADTSPAGAPFMVMELLEGKNLSTLLRDEEAVATEEVVDWVVQICSGMAEAHDLGIVHRDLKPSNVLVSAHDRSVRILDFGASRMVEGRELTAQSEILGTPNYIAPEVILGTRADARADLYAIGVIAFRALTGRYPCEPEEGSNPLAALFATVNAPAQPLARLRPDLPAGLTAAIDRALAKEPWSRYSDARAMAAAFQPFANGASFEEPPPSGQTLPDLDGVAPGFGAPLGAEDTTTVPRAEREAATPRVARPTFETLDAPPAAVEPEPVRPRRRGMPIAIGALVVALAASGALLVSRRLPAGEAVIATPPSAAAVPSATEVLPAPPEPSARVSSVASATAPPAGGTSLPRVTKAAAPARSSAPVKVPQKQPGPAGSGEVLYIE